MTRIHPFRALRYDPSRVDLDRVLVPPYDVVAREERATLYDRDPHGAIRLELTRDVAEEADTDYAEVRDTLEAWRREGVLRLDAEPALYALRQRFVAPDGGSHTRDGFFCLLHLEDYERRIVRPHERTLAGPKADRLKILRAARANLSAIFLLYEDRDGELSPALAGALESGGLVRATDASGTEQSLARLDAPDVVERIRGFLAERPLVIADGHHRYETALAYRDAQRPARPSASASGAPAGASPSEAPADWVLVYLANAFAPGTLLLPIHRLIRKGQVPTEAAWRERLPDWSQRTVSVESAEAIPRLLAEHLAPLADRHAFAADDASGRLRIFSRPPDRSGALEDLGIRVVHREVIAGVFGLDEAAVREGAIGYPKSALQTARELRAGAGAVALYLNPLSPDDVFRVTAAGEVLPQKSTYFVPKLPTGLVFRLLDPEFA